MAAAGDDLQIGEQTAVVKRGRDLADTAAHLGGGSAGGEGACGLVALFLGAFTQNLVVVEGIAGHQHIVIDGCTGQLQVGVAVGVVGVGGLHRGQHIPEELLIQILAQNFGDDVFHGDLQLFAVGSFCQKLLGFFQIKGVAVDLGGHFEGFHIHGSIHGFAVELFVNGFQIDGLGSHFLIGHFHFDLELVHAVGIQNIVVDTLDVHIAAGLAGDENQNLGLSLFIEFVGFQLGHLTHQLPGGLFVDAVKAAAVFIQNLTDVIGIQRQVGEQSNGVVADEGIGLGLSVLFGCAGTAVIKGGFHGGIDIQFDLGILGGKLQNSIGQIDDHVFHGIGHIRGPMDGGGSFLGGHTADVYTGYGDIVEDQTVVFGATQEHNGAQREGGNQQYGNAGNGDPQDLAALCVFAGGCSFALPQFLFVIVIVTVIVVIIIQLIGDHGSLRIVNGGLMDEFRFFEGHGLLGDGNFRCGNRGLSIPDGLENAGQQSGFLHGRVLNALLNGRHIFGNAIQILPGLPGLGKFTFGYEDHLLCKRWDILGFAQAF